jgi:predicted AlkP superfamily pyrophosphatase or phosphodiesterase
VTAKKLVLAVIDALSPDALERTVAEGHAPALAELMRRGVYVRDCVSTFPSLTPVAASAITTGLGPDEHLIPSMNWYHRGEERYVEYGSSFPATRTFGVFRSLQDTVYNMNLAHLTHAHRTVFEHLDDAGVRTACTTYLIYRGRHRHEPSTTSRYRRLAEAAQFRHAVWGARELFYADLFDSRETGCSSVLGMPGQRDRHAGCVGAHLVENDLFDFLLLSLPDNDTHSHKSGPAAQPASVALADRALQRVFDAAGGTDAFLRDHAVVVISDHSQSEVTGSINLAQILDGWKVLAPLDADPESAELAVCPGARSAMVYLLDASRREEHAERLVDELRTVGGIDLVARREGSFGVVVRGERELRFAPGGDLLDERGLAWSVEGDRSTLDLRVEDGVLQSGDYPDALGRLWSALECDRAGEVLLSAAPGFEFMDWGGADHVGGGSHGSLHSCDSLGALLMCGLAPELTEPKRRWHLRDVTPMVLGHFGIPS